MKSSAANGDKAEPLFVHITSQKTDKDLAARHVQSATSFPI
jgi:hypothetical protein